MDLPSDSDESDVDFVPDCEEVVSEAESEDADQETDAQYENEVKNKKLKRQAKQLNKKSRKKPKLAEDEESPAKCDLKNPINPEETKKYEDDLWASFLDKPTPSKPVNNESKTENKEPMKSGNATSSDVSSVKTLLTPDVNRKTVNDLFSIEKSDESQVERQLPVPTVKGKSSISSLPIPSVPSARRSGGGLASVLNKINKKDKVSTLEKSKLDWTSFKKEEGIEEDISIHNRGRDGYLDRQDFLQRTDLNQFEIEKSLRTNKRSSR